MNTVIIVFPEVEGDPHLMVQSGDSLGPYTLVRIIGRGAFGEVWLADRASSLLTTQVALKLPLDATVDLELIRQEAQVWLKASGHPNIVPVLEAEVYGGQVVISSEYVAGGSLSTWLEQHRGKAPSVEEAVTMIHGVLDGLQHLHEASLIHRDLKPDNILLQKGRPRLTDFGLTRILKPSRQTTNLAGTPGYMAPEAFQGRYSPSSDIWAVGMLLHEMLTGALPYAQADFYSLLLAITSDTPVPLSIEIPERLQPVMTKALSKPVGERFGSAAEMAKALNAAMTPCAAAAPSPSGDRNNLPVQVTSFIGRQKEITEIKTLLARTRLLALTGSGGCGKTRLSLQAAAEVLGEYADGVWFVELAPLADPALVVSAVAQVLGVSEEPGKSLVQTLAQALKAKVLLIVLDNCEHLLAACAQLVDRLLHACPAIKVLASSREGLNVAGELTYRVPSLSLPEDEQTATADSIRQYDAARLFIDRAQFHQPSFSLTDSNARALASICQRLDGIPLAIELAAARVRSLPVEQIEARLHDRFRLLTGGSRTALPRQQTLRALIDWSYDLLTPQEKAVLPRFSVFADGWTLEAAEKVCADGAVEEWDLLDLLTALVDKSLVVYEERRGQGRYRLLETVRQYARDRQFESGESETVRTRHQEFFLSQAETAYTKLIGGEQKEWLDRLTVEHENLRAALEHSLGKPESSDALRLCGGLWRYWWLRGHLSEGREWCERALREASTLDQTMVRGRALSAAGMLALYQGDFAAAQTYHEACLSIARENKYQNGISASLGNLALVAYSQGDYGLSQTYHEESLSTRREIGDQWGIAAALGNMGSLAYKQGDYPLARNYYEESLSIHRGLGDRISMAGALGNLGCVAYVQGDYPLARSYIEESLSLAREIGDQVGTGSALSNLGSVAYSQGDHASARNHYEESLSIYSEIGDRIGAASLLDRFAWLLVKQNQMEKAGRLWGAAERLRQDTGATVPPDDWDEHQRSVAAVRQMLGEEALSAFWEEGRAMTTEQAVDLALAQLPTPS